MCIRHLARERARRVALLSALGILSFAALACDDKRRHLPSDEIRTADVAAPLAQTAAPEEVARAFLTAVRDAQHARAHGLGSPEKKRLYDEAMGVLKNLTAVRTVHRDITHTGTTSLPRDISEAAAVTTATESWVSILAHYVDGFDLDSMRIVNGAPVEPSNLTIHLQAEPPEDARRLRELRDTLLANDNAATSDSQASSSAAGFATALREKALALDPPIVLPLAALIQLHLTREDTAWRIRSVSLGRPPSPLPLRPPAATPTPPQPTSPIASDD
ncbi:MAG: hypothetical protein ABII12_12330 [Planctomycetota bacterium]